MGNYKIWDCQLEYYNDDLGSFKTEQETLKIYGEQLRKQNIQRASNLSNEELFELYGYEVHNTTRQIFTKLDEPMSVANMLWYIVGEEAIEKQYRIMAYDENGDCYENRLLNSYKMARTILKQFINGGIAKMVIIDKVYFNANSEWLEDKDKNLLVWEGNDNNN